MPGPVSRTDTKNEPLLASALMATSPASVNLMALPTRLISTWVKRRSSPRPGGSSEAISTLKRELFVRRQRLKRAADGLSNVLNAVVGEFEFQLTSLDLGEVEHVIDEPKQVLAIALQSLEHSQHLFRRLAVSAVRHQFGVAQDGIERRAQLVAHIGEKLRLVLARLFKLPALVLNFVKQPHVLNRNRSLVGKGRNQFDLLVGEWSYFRACQSQDADRDVLAQHWNTESCAKVAQSRRFNEGVFRISLYVGNMNDATFDQRAS